VILKSAVAVLIEVAADPGLRARRSAIVDELALMIDSYLVAGPLSSQAGGKQRIQSRLR
jgi:hypothetical protein